MRQKIHDYNISSENINEEIYNMLKRYTELSYNELKCVKCGKEINVNTNLFFLFPCGHIFDIDCLTKTLIEYDQAGIGDTHFMEKSLAIKSLNERIRN